MHHEGQQARRAPFLPARASSRPGRSPPIIASSRQASPAVQPPAVLRIASRQRRRTAGGHSAFISDLDVRARVLVVRSRAEQRQQAAEPGGSPLRDVPINPLCLMSGQRCGALDAIQPSSAQTSRRHSACMFSP
jgi:hypothetical protein